LRVDIYRLETWEMGGVKVKVKGEGRKVEKIREDS